MTPNDAKGTRRRGEKKGLNLHIPRPVGAFESVLKAGYIFQITKEFSVQPDIQYIIRPGGFGESGNALVLGLQVSVEL